MPHYNFQEFFLACSEKGKVYVTAGAKEGAKQDFHLDTQQQILDFIANGGLEDKGFINSNQWENNRFPDDEIIIDAYRFRSGGRYGYLAFLFSPHTNKWLIKSFKRDSDPINMPLADNPELIEFKNKLLKKREEESDEYEP